MNFMVKVNNQNKQFNDKTQATKYIVKATKQTGAIGSMYNVSTGLYDIYVDGKYIKRSYLGLYHGKTALGI